MNERGIQCLRPVTIRWLLIFSLVFVLFSFTGGKAEGANAYGYIVPSSSYSYLSYSDIADMPLQVICYAKNEIYARNGRMFYSSELQNYFNQQYWYTPLYTPEQFNGDMLNIYENSNIALLASREAELGMYSLDVGAYNYSAVYQYISDHYYAYYGGYYWTVDPDSYIFYDSDRRYLTSDEISSLSLQEMCYARNEIYARRGRMFQSQELSNYFDQKNWYWGSISPTAFSESVFNIYEMTNVQNLVNAEYGRAESGYQLDQPGYSYAGIGSYTTYNCYASNLTSDYIFWDSNIRYLGYNELAGMTLRQLCFARNEIYARRGYIFQSQELREYFGSKWWYHGSLTSSTFSSSVFNDYEKANIELLRNYEYSVNPNGYQLY